MAKGQRKKSPREPTKKVWNKIHLQGWREKAGLSIEALAEKSGVSPGQISLIENKKSAGSPDTLEKLAKALGREVGELLDVKPDADGAIVRIWVRDSDRSRLLGMADALSKIKDER